MRETPHRPRTSSGRKTPPSAPRAGKARAKATATSIPNKKKCLLANDRRFFQES